MKLETLQKLWNEKNPGGFVMYSNGDGSYSQTPNGKSKKFAVSYKPDGKVYEYSAASVHALAERFELIPNGDGVDYCSESRKAIEAVDNGETFITTCGLFDTIRSILADGKYTVILDWQPTERDEYDRDQWTFSGYKIYGSWAEYEQDKYGVKQ